MTIAEALAFATKEFRDARIPTPALDAEVLLAHILKRDRSYLLVHPEPPLTATDEASFKELLRRRIDRVPVAYLVRHKEFFGLDFLVTPDVLIPRPETETLVELVLEYVRRLPAQAKVIDVGTGSGAIACAIASVTPSAISITALDSSEMALCVARANAERLGLAERITFVHSHVLDNVSSFKFQVSSSPVIVANLPYLSPADYESAVREFPEVAYEPKSALIGGENGIEIIERLLKRVDAFLAESGRVFLEIGESQGERVCKLARRYIPCANTIIEKDLGGRDRFALIAKNC